MNTATRQSINPSLTHGALKPLLVKTTLPVIWGTLLLLGFGLVDTLFVSFLGERQLAAISFTFPVTFSLISLNIGIGIGTAAVIARLVGAGERVKSQFYGLSALLLSLLSTALAVSVLAFFKHDIFKLLGVSPELWPMVDAYISTWLGAGMLLAIPMVCNSIFRANGDTMSPSKIMALGGLINVVLDPLLIFGCMGFPGFGIQGAAIATLIAWFVCSLVALWHIFINRRWVVITGVSKKTLVSGVRSILTIAAPAAFANMLTPIAGAIMMAIISSYGYQAVAAWGVGGRLESIITIVVLSLSMSLPPVVAQNFGAEKYDRVRSAYAIATKFVVVWQLLMYLLGIALIPVITWLFTDDPTVSDVIKQYMYIVPLAFGAQGIVILTNSTMNALHCPSVAMALNINRLFICLLPCALIGSHYFGLQGLLFSTIIANVIAACMSLWVFHKKKNELFSQHHPSAAKGVA